MSKRDSVGVVVAAIALVWSTIPAHSAATDGNPFPWATQARKVYRVTDCVDSSGPDTFRSMAAQAHAGDIVDLSQLSCPDGGISLSTAYGGVVEVDDVLIRGPGQEKLFISALQSGRVLHHIGSGTLTITGLTIKDGAYYSTDRDDVARGGCILSGANVSLKYSTVSDCVASMADSYEIITNNYEAQGGGIYAKTISLDHSKIAGNLVDQLNPYSNSHYGLGGGAYAEVSVDAAYSKIANNAAGRRGGGLYESGSLNISYSTISGNSSVDGGGVSGGDMTIVGSTFSANHVQGFGGAIYVYESLIYTPYIYHSFSMTNSTVSGNSSTSGTAGVSVSASLGLHVYNSTIVGNTTEKAGGATAGIWMGTYASDDSILSNSIVALNTSTDGSGVDAVYSTVAIAPPLGGSNNLILTGALTDMPNAIHGCPRISALGNHGGPTQTHALAPSSPAVDAGINAGDQEFDQRGTGFARVVGAAADVGAYERQQTPAGTAAFPTWTPNAATACQ